MTPSRSQHAGQVFLGCSGWAYPSWKPDFYPDKTSAKKMLPYYASQLNSVEVNYTFRQLPKPATIESWLAAVEETPFRFSFKAPQGVTHFKRLVDCAAPLERLYAALQPVLAADRLGVVLFQLPPNFKMDAGKLLTFLEQVGSPGVRLAFEFRHASWFAEEVFAVMKKHNAALCVAESDELATPDVRTADFACFRLRKTEYSAEEMKAVAADLKAHAASGDVFAYFKHEEAPHGPLRAREVLRQVREP